MTKQKNFGADFNNLPDTSHLKKITLFNTASKQSHSIDNIPGKQASVKILFNIATRNNLKITSPEAQIGLDLFGDHADEERQQANAHPNIRFLINVIANNEQWLVKSE